MSETRNPQAELFAALAKAQAKFGAVIKNRTVQIQMKSGGKFAFRYADIEEILAKTRPALAAEGIAVLQLVQSDSSNGAMWIETILTHAGGGMLTSRCDMKPAAAYGDPKDFGAYLTYVRRYALSSMLAVAADDDLDEQQGKGKGAESDSTKKELPEDIASQVAGCQDVKALNALFKSLDAKVRGAAVSVFSARRKELEGGSNGSANA